MSRTILAVSLYVVIFTRLVKESKKQISDHFHVQLINYRVFKAHTGVTMAPHLPEELAEVTR